MEVAGLFAEIRKKLRVDQGSARGSVKLFFSTCTKCPALSERTDLVYAPVPRRSYFCKFLFILDLEYTFSDTM